MRFERGSGVFSIDVNGEELVLGYGYSVGELKHKGFRRFPFLLRVFHPALDKESTTLFSKNPVVAAYESSLVVRPVVKARSAASMYGTSVIAELRDRTLTSLSIQLVGIEDGHLFGSWVDTIHRALNTALVRQEDHTTFIEWSGEGYRALLEDRWDIGALYLHFTLS